MKINHGLKNGAVLQRDENGFCKCIFGAEAFGEIKTSLGKIEKINENAYILSGIPIGGPYEIIISDDKESLTLSDIYVGDLWLLAGQSNMEGAGKHRGKYKLYDENPLADVRAYYMNESWGAAKTQLHQLWESIDECIRAPYRNYRKKSPWGEEFPKVQTDGVGPGLFFALEMRKLTEGVPQGVIPCGVGGSNLKQWDPDGVDNLYSAAKRRVKECGSYIKGVFWHQGESQTDIPGIESFISDMKKLVSGMRRDFCDEKLPFVEVQINKFVACYSDIPWSRTRELQRILENYIDNLTTVYSVDLELDDLIHLSSESHEILGFRAAEAMNYLITGKGEASPSFDSFEIVEDDFVPFRSNIRVNFKNIKGELTSLGVPSGFSIHEKEDGAPLRAVSRLCLEGDSVRIKTEIDAEKLSECYICYGFGNSFYCNITDTGRRSIPAFGPLKIKDFLKKEKDYGSNL